MCRGGVALPRLTFDFFVGDMSPSSMPPSKSKPSTPSGDGPMKLGEARFVGVEGSAPRLKPLNVGSPLSFSTPKKTPAWTGRKASRWESTDSAGEATGRVGASGSS